MPPELQRELRETFRPAQVTGNPRQLRAAHLRLVRDTRGVSLTNTQVVLLGLGAAGVGAIVGWFWRKRREAASSHARKSPDLVGLDVVCSLS